MTFIIGLFPFLQGSEILQKNIPVDKEIQELVGQMTAPDHLTFANPIEGHIVQESLCPILEYLKKDYPGEQWMICSEHLKQGKTFSETLIEVYGRTPAQVIIELIKNLKDGLPESSQGTLTLKELYEFKIRFYDEERPNDDYLYIEYLFKTYSEGIGTFFWSDEQEKMRYQKNLKNIKDASIDIVFITDAGVLNKAFRNKWQTAATNMNLKNVGDELFIEISLFFPYPHLMISSTFTHELAHVIQLLSMVDVELTQTFSMSQINSDDTKSRIKKLTSVMTNLGGGPLNEGLAEFLSQQTNLMYKYKFFDDVDVQLRQYFKKTGQTIQLEDIKKKIIDPDIDTRVFGYHVSHSLFRFILARFGRDTALRLMASAETDDDYKDALGLDLETLDKDWHEYIETETEDL